MQVASTARSDEWGGCSPAGLRLLLRFALGILAMSVLSDLVLPHEAERRARRDLGRGRRRGALLDRAHARRRLPPRLRADVVGPTMALLTVVVLVHVVVPRDVGEPLAGLLVASHQLTWGDVQRAVQLSQPPRGSWPVIGPDACSTLRFPLDGDLAG